MLHRAGGVGRPPAGRERERERELPLVERVLSLQAVLQDGGETPSDIRCVFVLFFCLFLRAKRLDCIQLSSYLKQQRENTTMI